MEIFTSFSLKLHQKNVNMTLLLNLTLTQGCADGEYFQICKKVGQILARQAARGFATVFSLTFF